MPKLGWLGAALHGYMLLTGLGVIRVQRLGDIIPLAAQLPNSNRAYFEAYFIRTMLDANHLVRSVTEP